MLYALSQNYQKIAKKIPQQTWKTLLYSILMISWAVIIFGTFLLLKS